MPSEWRPTLVVVVDSEEEFDWARFDPEADKVTNIALQPMAQAILDRHGIVPTYVVDYPVATKAESVEVLRPFLDAGRCEIGAHLHPWVCPPHEGPVDELHSYPGNLPPALERAKLIELTEAISRNFGRRPTIYKAGRYGVGPATAGLLTELRYEFDISVVPYTDYSAQQGPDFWGVPAEPFLVAPSVLAIPQSVEFTGLFGRYGKRLYPPLTSRIGHVLNLEGLSSRLGLIERLRLTPEGFDYADLVRQTLAGYRRGRRLFMLSYHSSSLLPGATSYVRTEGERDVFLATLDRYCAFFTSDLGGVGAGVTEVGRRLMALLEHHSHENA